ncbi:MAG: Transcriptional regulator, MarR family [Hydrogenibacillus schlegelii]|uniref:Transcriptional regulator, MarR family n=1 Tax=Hydrogenibacillus schlegelii TaxID=1484 RepID=A0A2T5GBY6_HYDSH|nr:MAG: Transcriptional regulator, MarR family [Hydrogenibacillus schlegelii]
MAHFDATSSSRDVSLSFDRREASTGPPPERSTLDVPVDPAVAEVEWLLRYISGIIKQRGREILRDFPITPPQFVALQWLKEHGDMTIGELSEKMYLANSTTTDLVDRMEASGLVRRVRSATDRRVVYIHLLDKGRTIIDAVIRARQRYLAEVLASFAPEDVERLIALLGALYRQMKGEPVSDRNRERRASDAAEGGGRSDQAREEGSDGSADRHP